MSTDTKLAQALSSLDPMAEVILKAKEVDWTNEDFAPLMGLLSLPLRQVLMAYEGHNTFLLNVRRKSNFTVGMARAVANIFRRELRGEAKTVTKEYECFYCPKGGEVFKASSLDEVYRHQADAHQRGQYYKAANKAPSGIDTGAAPEEIATDFNKPVVAVLPDYVPKFNVDLRAFLPGRFCVEDAAGELQFFIVTSLKRRSVLKGKYVWTKFRYANEYLNPGDRTVRKQSGDTKEYIGKQKLEMPVYFGEYEELMLKISENPIEAMERYGKERGMCAYCGRSLTDPLSRTRGIGPDCWEEKHVPQVMKIARNAAAPYMVTS